MPPGTVPDIQQFLGTVGEETGFAFGGQRVGPFGGGPDGGGGFVAGL
ncbi:hypothetical protein [Streptomyces sp. NPDC096132]